MHMGHYRARRQVLLNCAYTCKAWAEIALDDIWDSLMDFEILLRVLPSYREDIEGKWSFSREPTEAEWGRFRRYCQRVTGFEIERRSCKHVSESVFDALLALDRRRRLFPRVNWLVFNPETFSARHASMFLTSAITGFIIVETDNEKWEADVVEDVKYFLRTLFTTPSPNMTEILVGGPVIDTSMLENLCKYERLDSLEIHLPAEYFQDGARAIDVLRKAWGLPRMQRFAVILDPGTRSIAPSAILQEYAEECLEDDEEARNSLEDLTLHGQIPAICDLLRLLPADNLELSAMKSESQAVWDDLVRQVLQQPSKLFCILWIGFICIRPDWQSPLAADIFLQMPTFPNLFKLRISAPFIWTDSIIDHLARSCPGLVYVSLFRSQEYFEDDPQLTSASLRSFALHCPSLEVLHINVDPTRITPEHISLPAGTQGNVHFEKLLLEDFIWDDPFEPHPDGANWWTGPLSVVIDCLFPQLKAFGFYAPPPGIDPAHLEASREEARICVVDKVRKLQRARGLAPPDLIADDYPPDYLW
ncbi:hypothetical protein PUNSTDRAFT_128908 [Punctularia strigosozonata HHB-11173 SS5]|uniref:uncharacterized protein n=1 Tax=Punctularia strigosozonata (strain HHB-11173) TaxID=741275 RepID=UPI0004416938|nr:uncharacterized protein PUNSTDRAFT_128908 [Punctularia strigosozonata HHB-11173 SS5]EIN13218.1 hypothetical protein PUNSTDRAFT_128908 [Punctularia strigosozonata HHB-11173 SS5]